MPTKKKINLMSLSRKSVAVGDTVTLRDQVFTFTLKDTLKENMEELLAFFRTQLPEAKFYARKTKNGYNIATDANTL